MNKMATDRLLCALFAALNWEFMTGLNLEIPLSTETIKRKMHEENIKHLVLIGASHLKCTIPHLQRLGYEITDVTNPGRVISAAVVEQLRDQLKGISVPAAAVVVMDLFGMGGGGWHTCHAGQGRGHISHEGTCHCMHG
jgi:hypothetical protein